MLVVWLSAELTNLRFNTGAYILHDDLHLATPPPHPSEAPPANPNPLLTVMGPPSAGTRLSMANLAPPKKSPIYNVNEASSTWSIARHTHSIKESAREGRSSGESAGGRTSSDAERPPHSNGLPTFGNGNTLLAPPVGSKDTKRRKPKSNMVKSNSSFISRVIPNENLAKKLQERDMSGPFAFVNINRAFQWLDLGSSNMVCPNLQSPSCFSQTDFWRISPNIYAKFYSPKPTRSATM